MQKLTISSTSTAATPACCLGMATSCGYGLAKEAFSNAPPLWQELHARPFELSEVSFQSCSPVAARPAIAAASSETPAGRTKSAALIPPAAHGLQGLHGLQALAAHGLHGLQALAAHGLHGLHALAAQGLHGLQALAAQGLHGLQALAAQGLHGLQALAAQGLHGLHALAAQGLHGLHGLQALAAALISFFAATGKEPSVVGWLLQADSANALVMATDPAMTAVRNG